MIKYKGFPVAPAEVEAVLMEHPGVRDCGVIARPNDVAGEIPCAFVVLREGSTASPALEKELSLDPRQGTWPLRRHSTTPRRNSPKPCSRIGRPDGYPYNAQPAPARASGRGCHFVSYAETSATGLRLRSLSKWRAGRGDKLPLHE